jgi:hypothetical protein
MNGPYTKAEEDMENQAVLMLEKAGYIPYA